MDIKYLAETLAHRRCPIKSQLAFHVPQVSECSSPAKLIFKVLKHIFLTFIF